MLRSISVLPLDDSERATALELLARASQPEDHGAYIVGKASEETLLELSELGILFNEEQPSEPLGEPVDAATIARAAMPAATGVASASPWVLRLDGLLTETRADELSDRGIKLDRRLAPGQYRVDLDPQQFDFVHDVPWAEADNYGARATADAALLEDARDSLVAAAATDGTDPPIEPMADEIEPAAYDLRCHEAGQLQRIAYELNQDPRVLKVESGSDRLRYWVGETGTTAQELFLEMASSPLVELVEPYTPPEPFLSYAVACLLGSAGSPTSQLRWRGAGEVIGIADSGVDAEHPDLVGRVAVSLRAQPLSLRDPKGHGTHVASIAAGSGAASGGKLAGVAPEARLFVQSLADQDLRFQVGVGLKPLFQEAFDRDVRVHNLSWGSHVQSRYTMDSSDVDAFVYDHPEFLVVIAAGNDGEQDDGGDPRRIKLNSLASPASAKNCLTVGACCSPRQDGPYAGQTWRQYGGRRPPQLSPLADMPLTGDPNVVAALSSRGPSDDGRLKPELIAPGVGIAAAHSYDAGAPTFAYPDDPQNHYAYLSGTSMAAPLVSGAAALLRQYFKEVNDHRPSAALLKATLINGTRWIEGELVEDETIGAPNFHQGFGVLDLSRTIPLTEEADLLFAYEDVASMSDQALVAGDAMKSRWQKSYAAAANRPFSVTMTWTDPPGRGLQHELDLVVVSPSGTKFAGNPHLHRLPFEQCDRRNTVEQVRVLNPEPGNWAVGVFARNTFRGPQGFALAVTGLQI